MNSDFSQSEKAGLYRAIECRRDVRAFRADEISEEILNRILQAAHQAPSVGLMQPWNFIIIKKADTKTQVKKIFLCENEKAEMNYSGPKRELYQSLKLEGIEEAPINICVTCDRTRSGPHVLGRNSIIDTDLYSTCCAIQNLWLAARAEGVGIGWVSIVSNQELRRILGIPEHVLPIAYLCMGYPREFFNEPELQKRGWANRLPLEDLLFQETWGTGNVR